MLLATTQVEDFDRFLDIFSTKGAEKRKQHGSKGAHRLPRSLRGGSGLGHLRLGRAGLAELRLRPRGAADHEGGRAQVEAAGRAVRRPLRRLTRSIGEGRRHIRVVAAPTRGDSRAVSCRGVRPPGSTARERIDRAPGSVARGRER